MRKFGYSLCQRFMALLLCAAMLIPSMLTPAFATEVTEPAAVVETTGPAQEWTLPDCDCGSTEPELGKHDDLCALKVFLEKFCQETAEAIFAQWDKLPEECRDYVLEFLSMDEANAEKLAELTAYIEQAEASAEATEVTEAAEPTEIPEETKEALGIMPMSATNQETIYVIAASDYQNSGASFTSETSSTERTERKKTVENISNRINQAGIQVYGALFCGDYTMNGQGYSDGSGNIADDKKSIAAGIEQLTWYAKNILGVDPSTYQSKMIFVQGNHDRVARPEENLTINNTTVKLTTSGAQPDTEHYGVFVLNNDDYGWTGGKNLGGLNCNGDMSTVEAAAKALEKYLQGKVEASYTKPIFIAAHTPLHYSFRTREHSDALYGSIIAEVLNEYGAKGLNIIYLFGHNHSASTDSYIGGASAYLGRGETLFVANPLNKDALPAALTLNFTYMNAGYLGYTRNSNEGGNVLSMAVFEITGDTVRIMRYSRDGMVPVRAKGSLYDNGKQPAVENPGHYGLTAEEMNAYMNHAYPVVVASSINTTDGNMGQVVELRNYSTAYYQATKLIENQYYLIGNEGNTTGDVKLLYEPSRHVREATAKIQKDSRGYYIVLDPAVAPQYEWQWGDSSESSENGRISTLGHVNTQGLTTYIQLQESGSDGLAVEGGKSLRTTTNPSSVTGSDKVYWGYDATIRNTGTYKGEPSGLFAHTVAGKDNLTDRYYLLYARYSDNTEKWVTRNHKGPTSNDCGPTYIYIKSNDYYDPTQNTKIWAGGQSEHQVVVNQFSSQDALKAYIKSKLTVYTQTGETVTTVSDFTLQGTANPGELDVYTLYVVYQGQTLAAVTVNVVNAAVKNVTVAPSEGTVYQNAAASTKTGSTLTITYDNGVVQEIPVTVGMLRTSAGKAVSTAKAGTQKNLTVVYEDATDSGYTLRVIDKNYPEYPDPGSVKVEKEGTPVDDFAKTGAANVELSATGVPLVEGIDIIVMVDTSSSMGPQGTEDWTNCRLTKTQEAIDSLIATLKGHVNSGVLGDTKIAIADFNSYWKASSDNDYATQPWGYYAMDGSCYVHTGGRTSLPHTLNSTDYTQGARTGVTNPLDLSAKAFVDVTTLGDNWAKNNLKKQSGTNYDFAFDAIYQLGHNIKEVNKANGKEDRQLVVIFLSDGVPFQYNYFMAENSQDIWEHWLLGSLNGPGLDALVGIGQSSNANAFRHFYNANEGRHWMAEAIKGDPDKTFKVIRKSEKGLEGVIQKLKTSGGGEQYMGYLPGLGAQMYTIALGIGHDNKITKETALEVLRRIATKPENFKEVTDYDELTDVFNSIGTTVVQAATQSYFLDTMGGQYDLYMSDKILQANGDYVTDADGNAIVPAIEVRDYTVNGIRSTEPGKVLERITFGGNYLNAKAGDKMTVYQELLNADGNYTKETITMKMGDLLQGKYVYYNTSKTESKTVTYFDKTITLAPETFFYITTTLVADTEFALNYYVYLDDALDVNGDNKGTAAGTYDTNKSAILYYKNFQNVDCTKETVSPKFSWEDAKVSYGFYLVDENGRIITDEATGATVTNKPDNFNKRVKVVDKTECKTFDLNTTAIVSSLDLEIPEEGYALYVPGGVTYNLDVWSGKGGGWEIDDTTGTTYITGYRKTSPNNASKKTSFKDIDDGDLDYYLNDTTVWFALVALTECVPDTVVVDYGLPVEIDVLANDKQFGTPGTLAGIGLTAPANLKPKNSSNQSLETGFGNALNSGLKYGTAKVENGEVVYTLNSMQMKDEEVFYYAMNYQGNVGAKGYYYNTVTVIPATTIYYEDSFVSYTAWNASDFSPNTDPENQWKPAAEAATGEQAQDRPGSLSANDADNIYGYDGAYTEMATYSMGSAMKFTANNEVFGEAQFTFWGTGFDVISMTSNTTGTISVNVYDADAFAEKEYEADSRMFMVDTYYGYKYVLCDVIYEWDVTAAHPDGHWARVSAVESKATKESKPNFPENPEDGDRVEGVEMTWIVDQNASDALYQVPVMKVSGLEYKRYTVIIAVYYMEGMDHREENGTKSEFDFYLDAIRIYDPANDGANSDVIKNAYKDDGEGWPEYFELRNLLISRNDFDSRNGETGSGIVFIDNTQDKDKKIIYTIEDYKNFGPNNELYLAPGQAVAFNLNVTDKNLAQIHLAMKSVGNGTAKATVYDASDKSKTNKLPGDIKTATDISRQVHFIRCIVKIAEKTGFHISAEPGLS